MPDGNNDDDDDTPWAKDLQRHCTIFTDRVSQYGVNILPPAKTKSFLQLLLDACKDKFIILLDIAALVSLAIGIYQDVRVTGSPEDNENVHWVEGFAIIVAVAVVVTVGSLNDYQKERQFQKLNAKKDCRKVRVVRNGAEMMIPIQCLMVGDILNIEPGDVLGADAVVIHSSNLKCDESSLTGESDAIKKKSYEDILEERRHMKLSEGSNHDDSLLLHEHHAEPFLLSGSKVIQGVGSC
ncbi:plasma membrane calcium, partial [Spiromyces aspiralis]